MINQSSGMVLCLKSVSNKLTLIAPAVVKRKHVSVPQRRLPQNLSKSSFSKEIYGIRGHMTPVSSLSTEASLKHLFERQLKSFSLRVTSLGVTHKSSHSPIIHFYNSKQYTLPWNHGLTSQLHCRQTEGQQTAMLAVPSHGIQDDFVVNTHKCYDHKPLNIKDPPLLYCDLEREMILLSQSTEERNRELLLKQGIITGTGNPADPPTAEQIEKVRSTLAADLPNFFVKTLDYRIYHPNIILENNIQGKHTKGVYFYVKQAAWLRTIGHLRFIYVACEVIKITGHPEDGTVKVRWRIKVIRFARIFKFWQMKIWDWSTIWNKVETWHDGFSTYYVLGDGLVHKHVADKMMPDQDQLLAKKEESKAPAATGTQVLLPFHLLRKPSKNSPEQLEFN